MQWLLAPTRALAFVVKDSSVCSLVVSIKGVAHCLLARPSSSAAAISDADGKLLPPLSPVVG
jgi:hypothetical protein